MSTWKKKGGKNHWKLVVSFDTLRQVSLKYRWFSPEGVSRPVIYPLENSSSPNMAGEEIKVQDSSEDEPCVNFLKIRGTSCTVIEGQATWVPCLYSLVIHLRAHLHITCRCDPGRIAHSYISSNAPWSLPWCPWIAPVEIYNFLKGLPLPRRKCLGALAL